MLYTAETDSVLYYTPQKQILHCVIHRRNSLCIELYTAEKDSAMCFKKSAICRTLQKQILQCAGHRKNKLSDEQDTAESEWKHVNFLLRATTQLS